MNEKRERRSEKSISKKLHVRLIQMLKSRGNYGFSYVGWRQYVLCSLLLKKIVSEKAKNMVRGLRADAKEELKDTALLVRREIFV